MSLQSLPDLKATPSTTEALALAKDIGLRYNRNYTALRSVRSALEVKKAFLIALLKQKKSLDEDVARLTVEVPAYEKRAQQLADWCADHQDMPEVSKHAEDLAKRIAKLTKELEARQDVIHRLEAGLPATEIKEPKQMQFNSNGDVIEG